MVIILLTYMYGFDPFMKWFCVVSAHYITQLYFFFVIDIHTTIETIWINRIAIEKLKWFFNWHTYISVFRVGKRQLICSTANCISHWLGRIVSKYQKSSYLKSKQLKKNPSTYSVCFSLCSNRTIRSSGIFRLMRDINAPRRATMTENVSVNEQYVH